MKTKETTLADFKFVMAHGREFENIGLLNTFALIQNFLNVDEDYYNFINAYSLGHKVHNVKSAIAKDGYFKDNYKLPADEGGVGSLVHKNYKKFLTNLDFQFYKKRN